MMRKGWMLFLLIQMVLGCNSKETHSKKSELKKIQLPVLELVILIPTEHEIVSFENHTIIHFDPDKRYGKSIALKKINTKTPEQEYEHVKKFKKEKRFYYNTSILENPGSSGGKEYCLEGILEIENRLYAIRVSDFRESGKGNPEFCFEYLATIEIIK